MKAIPSNRTMYVIQRRTDDNKLLRSKSHSYKDAEVFDFEDGSWKYAPYLWRHTVDYGIAPCNYEVISKRKALMIQKGELDPMRL